MAAIATGLQGGVHEVIVAVDDLDAGIEHWKAFGYAPVADGGLDAAAAERLYGHRSALDAVRLGHGVARSGLVRLQRWEQGGGPGLGAAPLRVSGSRWTVHRTPDITPALAWGRFLERTQSGVTTVGPTVHSIDAASASINHAVFTPLYRHVLMVRHGIPVPLYGTPDPRSLLRASEIAHAGIIVGPADAAELGFYARLGFRAMSSRRVSYDPQSVATQMLPLAPGETLIEHDFDAPGSEPGAGQLPGRLRAFVLEPQAGGRWRTQPADAGYNLYSIRHECAAVADPAAQLCNLGAEVLGDGADEFGTPCWRWRAPDGYQWLMLPPV